MVSSFLPGLCTMEICSCGMREKITMTGTDYKMWIGGKWCESASGESVDSINPATSEVIATIPRGTEADAHKAIQAARSAFDRENGLG